MLAPAELLQAARSAAPDGEVRNLSEQTSRPLLEEPGRGRRTTWEDLPTVEVAFGDVVTTFTLDRLDPAAPRWQAVTTDGDRTVAHQVVHGTGDVARVLAEARQLAGLPEPARAPQPTHLTFGGEA
jgi:hypothetical protein